MTLTLGSLFDGIGGWQLAAKHAGVEPLWSSEIEPFPCAVTAKHFPDTLQLGDITKLDGAELPPVDIVCAGSPCQDLSVAGKQEGLKGARSGLFLRAVDIVRRMRFATGGRYPRFFVWENVPGAFSSNRGMDFQAVLEEIGESAVPMPEGNRWAPAGLVQFPGVEIAWRVLDAQYWGVPQRRRRIFLVADFTGYSAGEILFERESVPWDSSAGGEAREGTSAGTESGTNGASGNCLTPWDCQAKRIYKQDGVFPCLQSTESNGEKPGSVYVPYKARSLTARNDGSPCVDRGPDIIAAGFKVGNSEAAHSGNKPAVAVYENHAQDSRVKDPLKTAPSLAAKAGTGGGNLPLVSYAIAGNIIGRENQNGGHHMGVDQEVSFTLNTVDRHAVAHLGSGKETVGCLMANCGTKQWLDNQAAFSGDYHVITKKSVRRLTQLECERLQGLPDFYTLIDDKSCSDTARYKALGNGMAQPCADYVMRRIVEVCGND